MRRQTAASAAASERGHYLTMMSARIALVGGAAGSLGRAATIAIRYSLVRRQGFQSSSASGGSFRAPENQIIDYRMNQYVRLLTFSHAFRTPGVSPTGKTVFGRP